VLLRPEVASPITLGAIEELDKLVQQIKCDSSSAPISPKLMALLNIAGHVQQGGKHAQPKASAKLAGTVQPTLKPTILC
jgi:hypothetical protein